MKNILLISISVLLGVNVYCQDFSIENTDLKFNLPNKHWYLHSEQDANGKHIVYYKREPIKDKAGREIIPNISIITEEVGDSADVILFSAYKRSSTPFNVDEVISHDQENSILKYSYAIGYRGSYSDKNSLLHSIYIIHLINKTTGVQIIMDMTEELFAEYGEEFKNTIESIREK